MSENKNECNSRERSSALVSWVGGSQAQLIWDRGRLPSIKNAQDLTLSKFRHGYHYFGMYVWGFFWAGVGGASWDFPNVK